MRMTAGFLLGARVLWVLFVVRMFLAIAGIAEPPQSWTAFGLYRGPTGRSSDVDHRSFLVLPGNSSRLGRILVGVYSFSTPAL